MPGDSVQHGQPFIKGGALWLISRPDTQWENLTGPLCLKCRGDLWFNGQHHVCRACKKEHKLDGSAGDIEKDLTYFIDALKRRKFLLKPIDANVNYAVTEEIDTSERWLRIRAEVRPEERGDIHIWIGNRKNDEGDKSHIIVSPSLDIRHDASDRDPSELVQEITVESGNKKRELRFERS